MKDKKYDESAAAEPAAEAQSGHSELSCRELVDDSGKDNAVTGGVETGRMVTRDVGTGVSPVLGQTGASAFTAGQAGTQVPTDVPTFASNVEEKESEKGGDDYPHPQQMNVYATNTDEASVDTKNAFLNYKELMSVFARVENIPLDREQLPRFLQSWLNLADKVTDASPGAKLTAFLAVLGVNIGNRVYMNNIGGRIFPNIWAVIIGPSSVSRKTTVLNLARSTMQRFADGLDGLSAKDYEREEIWLSNVTGAKLLSLLSINPNRLFFHNEISGFLAEMAKQYNQGMKQKITELYDGVSVTNLNMERCERIKNPALSILAASTESWFYMQLGSRTEQLSGFMQRFIYCIISDVDVRGLNFDYVDNALYREDFEGYESIYKVFRAIPMTFRLKASDAALSWRTAEYKERMVNTYELHNDPVMSYFTRIYDGYWYKFCILITLYQNVVELHDAMADNRTAEFFEALLVTQKTAMEAMYLCDYYFNNTLPLMKIMSEQDHLAGERKLVDILCKRFNGRASHSELMQYAHFDKKTMNGIIDTLLEMEVVRVEAGIGKTNKTIRVYVLDPDIMQGLQK